MTRTPILVAATLLAASFLITLPAEAQGRKIVVQGFSSPQRTLSLSVGASGMTLSEDGLDLEGSAQLGGMNLALRWDPVRWGGLELGLGGYSRLSDGGLAEENRSLVTLSWLWYFARHHRHRFYGITGVAGMSTDLAIGNTNVRYGEGGVVLGLGTEWLAKKRWLISFDVRALMLNRDNQEDLTIEALETPEGLNRDPFPEAWTTPPEERIGLMFNLGVGYRW